MKGYILIFLLTFNVVAFSSTDSLRSSYGGFANLMLNLHDADFSRIPDCPSCSPGFRSGIGVGATFGLLYEYPISKLYSLGARLSYQNISGLLTATEPTTIIVNSQAVAGEFEHTIDAKLSTIGFEPYLLISPFDKISFSVAVHIGSLMSKSYSQKEEITKPTNSGTFLDADGNDSFSRTRNEFSGDLEKAASLFIAPVLGVSYKVPLNKTASLNAFPEIFYQLGVTNIVDDPLVSQWTVNSLRAGISIKYAPQPSKEKINRYERIEKIDTLYLENNLISSREYKIGLEKSRISTDEDDEFIVETNRVSRVDTIYTPKLFSVKASINAVGLDSNFKEISTPKFIVEEFSTARLQPLLNYIFFDSLSSNINSRYSQLSQQEARRFSVDSLYDLDVIGTYRHVLNIIGRRMLEHSNANITTIGCNDGYAEKNNLKLSDARANSVKDYLVKIWGISANRIKIVSRELPELASTPLNDFEKAQENRRVEIVADNSEITKPVFSSFITRKTSLPGLRFKPTIQAEAGLNKWEVNISQDGKILKTFAFGSVKSENVDWILSEDQRSIPMLDKPIEYTVKAIDSRGNFAVSEPNKIDIEQITIQKKRQSGITDKEIDNYSLILFDFAKADISSANNEIISFIKSRLKANSKVEITGYTDRTGDSDYNKRLSEKRAVAVNSSLKFKGSTYSGLGEDVLLYDNDFPEGRFYCRTINILVEREIK